MNRDDPLYSISIAAKLCGVHPQTLRLYERQGLVKPARVAEKNRMYSQADIERLQRIQRLTQDLGVNLAGVEVILRLIDEMDRLQQDFEETFSELQREMEKRLAAILKNSKVPVPVDQSTPILRFRPEKRTIDL
jgi:MerR family transcriptional regulator/heat shock protein HspR